MRGPQALLCSSALLLAGISNQVAHALYPDARYSVGLGCVIMEDKMIDERHAIRFFLLFFFFKILYGISLSKSNRYGLGQLGILGLIRKYLNSSTLHRRL